MTRKRRRSGKTARRSNAAGLTALALCFTRQLQLQAPAAVVAGEPAGGPSTAAGNLVFSPVVTRSAETPATTSLRSPAAPRSAHSRTAGEGGWRDQRLFGGGDQQSQSHIDSILDPSSVDTLTTLVLCSAIYFKGRWEAPFAKVHTVVDKFYRLDGSTADVPFMCSVRSQFIAVRSGYKVLKLPYRSPAPAPAPRRKGSTTSESKPGPGDGDDDPAPKDSMCIFLPDEHDGLPGLVEKIASGPGFWHYRLPTLQVPVGAFRLPRFKLSVSSSVRQVLRHGMGIESVFVAGEADLADMAAKRDEDDAAGTPLYVADVCYKAVLEVNEGGTVANGATTSYMLCGASAVMNQPVKVDFVADHPFMFFVIEEVSRAIVFVGRVLDPSISG
ncbi:unnamed protein product [Miscanthus lutarioriparius]|uniref:Serpin domain-containing protein n=1 Tax=Miscanthus lutarioriparius TaxID=422564 RepID=A0A811SPF9_9POAL|nr:unnamed protein product [Miscanthus lutarioriparius]